MRCSRQCRVGYDPNERGSVMVEGFWLVQFEGMQGNGSGVVTLLKGELFGGDSQTTYIGNYEEIGNKLRARALVHNYVPGLLNIIGTEGDYTLDVEGTIAGDVITATGSPVGHDVAGMALKLSKLADLPT